MASSVARRPDREQRPAVDGTPSRDARPGRRAPNRHGRSASKRRGARPAAGLIGCCIIAAGLSLLYFGRGFFADPTNSWAGNPGDTEQFMWFLAEVPHRVLSGHNPFYTQEALYPAGANLMWNTSVIVPGSLISPVTLVFGPVVAYNTLLVLAPIATAGTAYLAIRRHVAHNVPAVLGALSFAFCPFMIAHGRGHLHLVLLALLPLIALLVDELAVRQRAPWWLAGGALGIVCFAQLLSAEELLAVEALSAGAAVVLMALLHPRAAVARLRYFVTGTVIAVVVFAVLSAYPLYVQLFGARQAPGAHEHDVYVADLLGLIRPVGKAVSIGGGRLPFTGNGSEWTSYLGLPLILLIIVTVALAWRRRPVVRVAAVIGALMVVLSFGTQLHVNGHGTGILLPWASLDGIDLLSDLLPGRISVVVAFFAAILLAVFIDLLYGAGRAATLAGAALVVLTAVSLVSSLLPTTRVQTPSFFTGAALDRYVPSGSTAAVFPYVYGPNSEHAMLWQANSGFHFRMVDGWLIVPGSHHGPGNPLTELTYPAQAQGRPQAVTTSSRADALAYLRTNRVQTVIVGPMTNRGPTMATLAALFGRRPDATVGDVDLWQLPDPPAP